MNLCQKVSFYLKRWEGMLYNNIRFMLLRTILATVENRWEVREVTADHVDPERHKVWPNFQLCFPGSLAVLVSVLEFS